MDHSKLKNFIDCIINKTFEVITEVYPQQKESSEQNFTAIESACSFIIFPEKHHNDDEGPDNNSNNSDTIPEVRISEQELRFIFIEQFNKYVKKENNLFYSIETPTEKYYDFSESGSPTVVDNHKASGKGRAANIDLVIHQKERGKIRRVALIEFKALNPDGDNYLKDICKLKNEKYDSDCLKYFIQIISTERRCDDLQESPTLKNICKKIKGDNNKKKTNSLLSNDKKDDYKIFYRCCNLRKKVGSQVQKVCGIIENNELTFNKCELQSTAESTK